MIARVSLLGLVLLVAVLALFGVPLGGGVGVTAAVVLAAIVAVPMGFVFSHGEHGAH